MKITFQTFEHSTLGFPRIKLKWSEENGVASKPRIVINNIMQKQQWSWRNSNPVPFYDYEIGLFDSWVRDHFSDDPSVQG